MYKVLVDTNIIIDFLYIRKPFYEDSKKIIQLIEDKSIKGYITTSILMDLHYIIWHRLASKKDANSACRAIMKIFDVLDISNNDIASALADEPVDFEDYVIEKCAKRNNCDYIVTRNIKHFDNNYVIEPASLIGIIEKNNK